MKDWIEKLFVEEGKLFGKILEEMLPRTKREAAWIAQVLGDQGIKEGSHLLDLGCGIGRHSIELSLLGYNVTGIDISPLYISRAKELAKKRGVEKETNFYLGDMRELDSLCQGKKFDAILNLFTSFGYYDQKTNQEILQKCRFLTNKKGLFLIDVVNRDWLAKNFQPQSFTRFDNILLLEDRSLNLETGRSNAIWTILEKQEGKLYEEKLRIQLDHQVYNLHELIQVFQDAGWNYQKSYGSLTGLSFQVASSRIAALFSVQE